MIEFKQLVFILKNNRIIALFDEVWYKQFCNSSCKLPMKTIEGYKFMAIFADLKTRNFSTKYMIFNCANPFTTENIILWCKLNNKSFSLLPNQIYKKSQDKMNWYCNKCKCIFSMSFDSARSGTNCGVCTGKQIVFGFNDLYSKRPDLLKYFINVEDAKKNNS